MSAVNRFRDLRAESYRISRGDDKTVLTRVTDRFCTFLEKGPPRENVFNFEIFLHIARTCTQVHHRREFMACN